MLFRSGLPPAHYGALYKEFAKYLEAHNDIVDFTFNKKPYSIYIREVEVYAQAFAAAMLIHNKLKDMPKVIVLDIGGFTVDYMQILKGRADFGNSDYLENGVITLYNQIIKKVNSEFDTLISEADIDAVIKNEDSGLSEPIIKIGRAHV